MTKTVRDNALLYGIISGRDECDSTTVDVPPVELPAAEDLKGLRVGIPKELNEAEGIEPGLALADELMEFSSERLAKYKLPKSIDFVPELPRDPNGKLAKRKLRDPLWAGVGRAI